MTTQAYFQSIRKYIKEELSSASQSIFVAVAWFTDKQLFRILCEKASQGIDVQVIVMDDDITRNCQIRYSEIESYGGRLYLISEQFGTLMHNKFCVIDEKTIITGSYNWSMKAASNHENITITKDAETLGLNFIAEFKRIKEKYHGKDPLKKIDYSNVYKRLQVIEGLIQLEEYNDIILHTIKIKEFELPLIIIEILNELEQSIWQNASNKINDYLKRSQAITVFEDLNLEEIIWKIKYLELEIVALENEKTTISKIISDFIHTYTLNFGDLLTKILKLKKDKLQAEGNNRYKEYKYAEEAYQNFKEEFEKEKEKNIINLSNEEKEELKKKYRKAASMCHPNSLYSKFEEGSDELKKAEELYIKLKLAFDNNDLNTVTKILENLENGIFDFQQEVNEISTKREKLEARLENLKLKLELLTKEVFDLNNNEIYIKITNIHDFEHFYQMEGTRLNAEYEELIK